MEQSEAELLTI